MKHTSHNPSSRLLGMKHTSNEEVFNVRNPSSSVPPNNFKEEVASIVKQLGNRLEQLLEQHETCLLKTWCYGAHPDLQEEHVQTHAGNVRLESDMVFPADSTRSSMDSEMVSLPGCVEAPPGPPDVKPWDSTGQIIQGQSTVSGRRAEICQEIVARSMWSQEHTDAQQEAIAEYEGSFQLLGKAGKVSRHTHRMSLGVLGGRAELKPTCAILHPVGQFRTFWNLVSLVLICQDALTVPLLVFEIGDSGPWEVLAWFCTLFWTADVFVAFRTGYMNGVKVELRPAKIAKQYAMTWLPFDMFIVVFEWFSRFFSSLAPPGVVRTTRVVRGVRLVKLLRITKMKGLVNEFSERLNSNIFALILNVFLLTVFQCIVCHFVTCMWYALGEGTSDGWTTYDKYADKQGLDQLGFMFWYLSSTRWVICQINGRTDMDERRNMPERGFTVIAGILLSIVGRSVFVALITKSMLQLSDLYKKKEERRRNVNDYLSLHPVPATLERSVKAHVHAYKDLDVEREREAVVLALLPVHLQKDLLYEVRKPLLDKHPLFGVIMRAFEFAARHLCFDVVKQVYTASQEVIFQAKDPCSRMLLMDTGSMIYGLSMDSVWTTNQDADSEEEKEVLSHQVSMHMQVSMQSAHDIFQGVASVTHVIHGMWVSEPAIWAAWLNKGTLITEDNSCMLEVDAMMLGAALQEHTDLFGLTVVYARNFLEFLRNEPRLSDILSIDALSVDPAFGDWSSSRQTK